MYILFINSGGRCDIFFSTQFNNNSDKKKKKICLTHGFNLTQLDSCELGWVGLM